MSSENGITDLAVVKHGSSTSENPNHIGISQGHINFHIIQHVLLRQLGLETAEVSSGLVVAGKEFVEEHGWVFPEPDESEYQTEAAIDTTYALLGMHKWHRSWTAASRIFGINAEPLLVTDDQLRDGTLAKPIVDSIRGSTAAKQLVVVNEDPRTASAEMLEYEATQAAIAMGQEDPETDNDLMAVLLAKAAGAKILLLLTNRDGFIADGVTMPRIAVEDIPDLISKHCKGKSNSGKGGMARKLLMAENAKEAGIQHVFIANAFTEAPRILEGQHGTEVV